MNSLKEKYRHTELISVEELHPSQPTVLLEAKVTSQLSNESWLLNNTHPTCRAFSCVIKPIVGDKVLYTSSSDGNHIISILTRAIEHNERSHDMSLPEQQAILFKAKAIDLFGKKKLTLSSIGDIEVNALLGTLKCHAKNLFQSIQKSLIQTSKQMVSRSEHIDLSSTKLLKTHSRHQIITADREMKIDADRINMG